MRSLLPELAGDIFDHGSARCTEVTSPHKRAAVDLPLWAARFLGSSAIFRYFPHYPQGTPGPAMWFPSGVNVPHCSARPIAGSGRAATGAHAEFYTPVMTAIRAWLTSGNELAPKK